MSDMSDYLEDAYRTLTFRTAAGFTKPTIIAHALYTAAPGEAGGGTEVTAGSYARVDNPPLDANWSAVSSTDGRTGNVAPIVFPTPTANWGLVTDTAQLDALTVGNLLFYGTLAASKTINNGDPAPSFPADAFGVTFA